MITADTHAGGSHEQYREYLDPEFLEDFDAWRGRYKNPFKDLRDTAAGAQLGRRAARLRPGGRRRRRRGALPQHRAALLPRLRALRRAAEARGVRAPPGGHPRPQPLARRLLRRVPERRAGIGQIFLNDIDDAIADVSWIKEHGLRGGVLLPTVPPDVEVGQAALRPRVRPAVGGAARTSTCRSTSTAAPARPTTARSRSVDAAHDRRGRVLLAAAVRPHAAVGACSSGSRGSSSSSPSGAAPGSRRCCATWTASSPASASGATSASCATRRRERARRTATEYFQQNCWVGVSQPDAGRRGAPATSSASDRFMWGSDYPHDEGTYPYTREHLRQVFQDVPEDELRTILGENAAEALRLRPGRAGAAGRALRTDGARSCAGRSSSCPRTRTGRWWPPRPPPDQRSSHAACCTVRCLAARP